MSSACWWVGCSGGGGGCVGGGVLFLPLPYVVGVYCPLHDERMGGMALWRSRHHLLDRYLRALWTVRAAVRGAGVRCGCLPAFLFFVWFPSFSTYLPSPLLTAVVQTVDGRSFYSFSLLAAAFAVCATPRAGRGVFCFLSIIISPSAAFARQNTDGLAAFALHTGGTLPVACADALALRRMMAANSACLCQRARTTGNLRDALARARNARMPRTTDGTCVAPCAGDVTLPQAWTGLLPTSSFNLFPLPPPGGRTLRCLTPFSSTTAYPPPPPPTRACPTYLYPTPLLPTFYNCSYTFPPYLLSLSPVWYGG